MVNEPRAFGITTVGIVVGLLVLLWGVSLNSGQALNAPMIAGGVIALAAVGMMTYAVWQLEGGHA